ncbi:MAG TPA: VanW family protein, partial [Candidatus Saccharimonadales bacterium]|nr:VanW family protein [Candidatus Saccharimonadales bacterium]
FSFLLGFVLVAGIALAALYAYDQHYIHKVLPGVHVGSVDLSGLDETAAQARLNAAYGWIGQGAISVTVGGATTQISYQSIKRQADTDMMVYDALIAGRATSMLAQALGEVQAASNGIVVQPTLTFDRAALAQQIQAIAQAAGLDPIDATATATATGYTTSPSAMGRKVDVGTSVADLSRQLASLTAPSQVSVTLNETPIAPAVDDATAAAAASQATAMSQAVTIVAGTDSWQIPVEAVHSWIGLARTDDNRILPTIKTTAIAATVRALASQINRPMVNASFTFLPNGTVARVTPSQDGRTLDATGTAQAVIAALQARGNGTPGSDGPIPAVVTVTKAALSTAQATAGASKVKMISTWTTYFYPGQSNGNGANIWIPAQTIDGYVVQPGASFSFWKAVGDVTLAKGYQLGGVIINGHSEETGAIGGGICSTSTTLFNAVLRAGFQMGDRLNHYYYITRYPVGLDATVFMSGSSVQDMTWTNDTLYPVLIRGITGPGLVRFDLYTVPNGRQVTLTKPIVTNYQTATTKTVYTSALPNGAVNQIEYADDGFNASVTRTVTDASGKVVHTEVYYSHYATVTGVIMIGQKGAPNIPIPTYGP